MHSINSRREFFVIFSVYSSGNKIGEASDKFIYFSVISVDEFERYSVARYGPQSAQVASFSKCQQEKIPI